MKLDPVVAKRVIEETEGRLHGKLPLMNIMQEYNQHDFEQYRDSMIEEDMCSQALKVYLYLAKHNVHLLEDIEERIDRGLL